MKEHTIFINDARSCEEYRACTKEWLYKTLDEFHSVGFNVTEDAIIHNFEAWLSDFKSGYLDEDNGYFLFTPCGCNPLQFEAMEIKPGAEWQKTYEA